MMTHISLPTPYPVGRVNVYLLAGERPTLVDVGVRGDRARRALDAALASKAGVGVEELCQILLTHRHYDHSGGALDVARASGAQVRCHPLSTRDEGPGRRAFLELFARHGAPAELVGELEAVWIKGDRFGESLHGAPEVSTINDGDTLHAGDVELEVMATPGHSPGHLCFLCRQESTLLCGDMLLAAITPNPLPHFDPEDPKGRQPSLTRYLESLDRVEALGPLRGLAGHGRPIQDTAEAAVKARRHIEQRSEAMERLLRANPGRNLFGLAQIHFAQPTAHGQALAYCEVLAHADLLEVRGSLILDEDTGTPAL